MANLDKTATETFFMFLEIAGCKHLRKKNTSRTVRVPYVWILGIIFYPDTQGTQQQTHGE